MSSYVSAALRRLVEARARRQCEYCLVHEDDTYLGCQVDHIISEKHGGPTEAENLAYACAECNRAKGTDVGTITADGQFTRLFHPRMDRWLDHFRLDGVFIEPLTPIGEATIAVLALNSLERIIEREALQAIGRYPPLASAEIPQS